MTLRTSRIRAGKVIKKPESCAICNSRPPFDLWLGRGLDFEDMTNWRWICRQCTMRLDGRLGDMVRRNKSRPKKPPKPKVGIRVGSESPAWKGDNISYKGAHLRVGKMRGRPSLCEVCETTEAKRFDWANVNGNYADVNDYVRLCRSCHASFDGKINVLRRNPRFRKEHNASRI